MDKNSINSTDELKNLLNIILKSNGHTKKLLIKEFEDKVNACMENNTHFSDTNISNIFNKLIADIAYYQPNPIVRLTDRKRLFGDKQLDNLIKKALDNLGRT